MALQGDLFELEVAFDVRLGHSMFGFDCFEKQDPFEKQDRFEKQTAQEAEPSKPSKKQTTKRKQIKIRPLIKQTAFEMQDQSREARPLSRSKTSLEKL